jgi:hypothetical protein
MLMVTQLAGFGVRGSLGGGGSPPALPSVSFRGSLFSDTINTRTYSTTIDLGTEHASRLIVVGAACLTAANEAPTGCTVDGAAATLAAEVVVGGITEIPAQLWYVARPTGGSVTVAITKPGGADMDRGAFGVWSVYDLESQTPGGTNTNAANPAVLDLTVPAWAVVFAVGNNGTTAITWGYTGVTSDAESAAQLKVAFASASDVPAGSPRDIELSGGNIRGVSAYWR